MNVHGETVCVSIPVFLPFVSQWNAPKYLFCTFSSYELLALNKCSQEATATISYHHRLACLPKKRFDNGSQNFPYKFKYIHPTLKLLWLLLLPRGCCPANDVCKPLVCQLSTWLSRNDREQPVWLFGATHWSISPTNFRSARSCQTNQVAQYVSISDLKLLVLK